MSDNIDYDELDRAIAETQKEAATKAKAPNKTTKTAKTSTIPKAATIPVNRPQPVQVHQTAQNLAQNFPPRRRVYMDFIGRPRRTAKSAEASTVRLKTAETSTPAAQPATQAAAAKIATPKRVARFATATPGMPSYRVANSHQPIHPQSIPVPIARKAEPVKSASAMPAYHKATPTQPAPKPVIKQAAPAHHIAAKTAARPVSAPATAKPVVAKPVAQPVPKPATVPSATATAASHAVETIKKGPTAPNANNYSLGVNSPYLRSNAPVQKRPLNGDVSEYVQDDKIEKNEYPEPKKAASTKKTRSKHTVKKTEKSSSGWYWPILVVLIVAAGGGLGYLLWWVLQGAS